MGLVNKFLTGINLNYNHLHKHNISGCHEDDQINLLVVHSQSRTRGHAYFPRLARFSWRVKVVYFRNVSVITWLPHQRQSLKHEKDRGPKCNKLSIDLCRAFLFPEGPSSLCMSIQGWRFALYNGLEWPGLTLVRADTALWLQKPLSETGYSY